jgi:hypothetical protein
LQGCFISDATISSGAAARRALSDDGREQRYLKTAHGRGFRFDGWLVAVEPTTSKESEAQGLRQQIRNCPHRGRHPSLTRSPAAAKVAREGHSDDSGGGSPQAEPASRAKRSTPAAVVPIQ